MDFEDWLRAELAATDPRWEPPVIRRRGRSPFRATPLLIAVQLTVSAVAVATVLFGAGLPSRLDAVQLSALAPAPALPVTTWAGSPPPPAHDPAAAQPNEDASSAAPDQPSPIPGGGLPEQHQAPIPRANGPAPQPAPPAPAQTTRTFVLVGGTVTIRCAGGTASVVSTTANSGFVAETEQQGSGVEVRFRSDTHESRLEAYCAGGAVEGQTEESSS